MKKIILGLIATMVALLVATTSVNAAEINVNANSAKEEGTVKVTLNLDEATDGVQFDLKYDSNIFEYASVEATGGVVADANVVSEGLVKVIAFAVTDATTDAVTVTFNVKAETAGEAGKFEVEGLTGTEEALATTTTPEVQIEAKEPATDPEKDPTQDPEKDPTQDPEKEPTQDPTKDPVQDPSTENPEANKPATDNKNDNQSSEEGKDNNNNNNNNNDNGSKLVDENGKEIKEIPQTGAPIIAGGIAVILVAGIVLVVRKIRK